MRNFISNGVLYATWFLLTIAAIYSLYLKEWFVLIIAVGTILLTLLPLYLQKKFRIYLSHSFISFSAVFIYATIFLGEVHQFYDKFWWWDLLWHLYSAIGFGLIGAVLLLLIIGKRRAESNPHIFGIFIFCFAVTVGVIWEIFEFSMDSTFGLNMQKSGLRDTMADIIINTIGACVASISGYLYVIQSPFSFFKDIIEQNYIANKSIAKHKIEEDEE